MIFDFGPKRSQEERERERETHRRGIESDGDRHGDACGRISERERGLERERWSERERERVRPKS